VSYKNVQIIKSEYILNFFKEINNFGLSSVQGC
jgi:hypothetical protein